MYKNESSLFRVSPLLLEELNRWTKKIYEIHPAKMIRRINGVNVLESVASVLKIY